MRSFIVLLCTLFSLKTYCQNLVPNPSFEDVNICDEYKAKCSPAAWFSVSRKYAHGYQYANHIAGASGKCYISIDVARPNSNTRQYWETMLLCNLQKGKSYDAKIKIRSDTIPDLDYIGFYFTDHFIFSYEDTLLQPITYLSFSNANVKRSENGWLNLDIRFIAQGDFPYLIIGNFINKHNAEILPTKNPSKNYSILIDDIVVTPKDAKPDCADLSIRLDSLYAITERHDVTRWESAIDPEPANDLVIADKKIDSIIIPGILFKWNSYTLQNHTCLDTLKQLFTEPSIQKIKILGFTDETGTEEYNKQLSANRAKEIESILEELYNIHPDKFEIEGRGVSHTYADNSKNRRVEIYIFH